MTSFCVVCWVLLYFSMFDPSRLSVTAWADSPGPVASRLELELESQALDGPVGGTELSSAPVPTSVRPVVPRSVAFSLRGTWGCQVGVVGSIRTRKCPYVRGDAECSDAQSCIESTFLRPTHRGLICVLRFSPHPVADRAKGSVLGTTRPICSLELRLVGRGCFGTSIWRLWRARRFRLRPLSTFGGPLCWREGTLSTRCPVKGTVISCRHADVVGICCLRFGVQLVGYQWRNTAVTLAPLRQLDSY